MKKNVLVVVAHPDDETIWMGGTLLMNKDNWNTTIISLCRKDDEDRAPKFKKVCTMYNAKCFMSDLEDKTLQKIVIEEVTLRIKQFANAHYDLIYTHGANGEYGHIRHKDTHKAVNALLKEGTLTADEVWFFAYAKCGQIARASAKAETFIKTKANLVKIKKKIIQKVYGFAKKSFEDKCCQVVEAFKKRKHEVHRPLSLSH